jgi:predicted membrane protein
MGDDRKPCNATLWTGVVAVLAGIVLFLDHLGKVNAHYIFRFWPVILIAIGLSAFLSKDYTSKNLSVTGGGMLAFWGTLLLLLNLGYLGWGQVWPIALIGVGLFLVWRSFSPQKLRLPDSLGHLHPTSVFASVQRSITDTNFQQGKAETVFGSIELDFIYADIPGDRAVLDVAVVFGSLEVRVPTNWNVSVETTAVFGSAENKTRAPLPTVQQKLLVVRGDVVFGSLEVKN